MANKTRRNFWVDFTLLLLFLGVGISGMIIGDFHGHRTPAYLLVFWVHILTGIAAFAGFTVHILLHWQWWRAVLRRIRHGLAKPVKRSLLLNGALVPVTLGVNLSGILLWLSGSHRLWFDLHSATANFIALGVLAHIYLHRKWIRITAKRLLGGRRAASTARRPPLPDVAG